MSRCRQGIERPTTDPRLTMSTETALRLLADRTRRQLLRRLQEAEAEAVPVDDLLAALAGAPGGASRRETAIALYHVHLPKLAAMDVVEWDRDRGTVRYGPTEPLEELLATVLRHVE